MSEERWTLRHDKWKVDLFGNGEIVIIFPHKVPLHRRILTKLLLGAIWIKLQ